MAITNNSGIYDLDCDVCHICWPSVQEKQYKGAGV